MRRSPQLNKSSSALRAGRKMHTFGNSDENNSFIANAVTLITKEDVRKKLAAHSRIK
jgi:cob(I)alamin adenosyltransferase